MMSNTLVKQPTIHKMEIYGGRGAGDRTVFCDFAIVDLNPGPYNSRLFAVSYFGTESDCEAVLSMLQDNKNGRIIHDSSNHSREGEDIKRGFSTGFKKKNFSATKQRMDDIYHYLAIDKQIESNAQKRSEFEASIEKAREEGNTPNLRMDEEMAELIIAWDGDIVSQVYSIIWDRYGTPMLPEWKDYLYEELMDRGYLRSLTTFVFGNNEHAPTAVLLKLREVELERIISDGINSLELEYAIEENDEIEDVLSKIENLTSYLTEFGTPLAENIKNTVNYRFNPMDDKHDEHFYDVNMHANKNGLTGLFPAQADAVMSCAKTLQELDYTFLIGEMGSGKTPSGMVIPYLSEAIAAGDGKIEPFRVIVMSPSIVVEKWKREIKQRIPNCEVYEIKGLSDAIALRNKPYKPEKIEYYVFSSELPKHKYPIEPIKDWRSSSADATLLLQQYRNNMSHYNELLATEDIDVEGMPEKPKAPRIRFERTDLPNSYTGNVDTVYAQPEHSSFHCPDCGGMLWRKNTTNRFDPADERFYEIREGGKWKNNQKKENYVCMNDVYTSKIHKSKVKEWVPNPKGDGYIPRNKVQKCGYVLWQNERLPAESKKRKVSPIWFINKYLPRGFFKYLLCDEVHEYKSGDSSVGQAFGQLINHTEKQVLLTGTLVGGMASDIFYLLARLDPKKLLKESIGYEDMNTFVERYGVFEYKSDNDNESGARRRKGKNRKPGISPNLFAPYLMPSCTFLELADLGYALPKYQEIPLIIEPDVELKQAYENLQETFKQSGVTGFKYAALCLNMLYQYLDAPYGCPQFTYEDPETGIVSPIANPVQFDRTNFESSKFRELNRLIDSEVYTKKRKVLVYAKYTGGNQERATDIYLYEKLKEKGYKVGILRSSGSIDGIKMPKSSKDREAWMEEMMEKHDWDVLITNPKLVKVGLDLLQFPTIVYYQMDYSTYDYMQSSRRSWRIKQTEEVCIYTMVYRETIQEQVLMHVAQKIDAALAMQGKFSEEGLRAMSDTDDVMNILAKQLMEGGIMDDVTDTITERMQRLNLSYEEMSKAEYEHYEHYEANPLGVEEVNRIRDNMFNSIIEEAQLELETTGTTSVATQIKVRQAKEVVKYLDNLADFIVVQTDINKTNKGVPKSKKVSEGQLSLDFSF